MPQLSAGESQALEREYRAHRAAVLAMLRVEFAGVPDHEELYQEAWAEALEIQARGGEIVNLGGLLRTIAWRRARDRLRKRTPDTLDPGSRIFALQADPGASPDEQLELRLDAALIRQVLELLEPRQAAAIKLRFDCHMDAREIQKQLGVTPKRLEKIVTEAYQRVERCLREDGTNPSEWRRHQRSLLLACETGLASARQRRRASQMVRDDPVCRAMLHEIRSSLEQIAALLPLPLLASPGRLVRLRSELLDWIAGVRDQLMALVSRASGHGAGAEEVGAAAAGSGAAAKAVLACVAITGTTVACLTPGIVSRPHRPHAAPSAHPTAAIQRKAKPRLAARRGALAPAAPARHPHRSHVVTDASAPAAPSPAPSGSTEFGPGSVGSSSASRTPSAAPSGGGGEFLP